MSATSSRPKMPKGVQFWMYGYYYAKFQLNHEITKIGPFKTPEEAHKVYLELKDAAKNDWDKYLGMREKAPYKKVISAEERERKRQVSREYSQRSEPSIEELYMDMNT